MCFHPLNTNEEWPTLLNNPFDYIPHALCIRAAELVREDIKQHLSWHEEVQKGKMFGVLLVDCLFGSNRRFGQLGRICSVGI